MTSLKSTNSFTALECRFLEFVVAGTKENTVKRHQSPRGSENSADQNVTAVIIRTDDPEAEVDLEVNFGANFRHTHPFQTDKHLQFLYRNRCAEIDPKSSGM